MPKLIVFQIGDALTGIDYTFCEASRKVAISFKSPCWPAFPQVRIVEGKGMGQVRRILWCFTRPFLIWTLDMPFNTAPDETSVIEIWVDPEPNE